MNFNGITRFAAKSGHLLQKHAPTILTAAGIVGGVTAAVLGAKAALKSEPLVKKLEDDLEVSKSLQTTGQYDSTEDRIKHLTYIYVSNGKEFAKLYAPAVSVGIVSVAAILWGHGMLRSRNAALTVAYASLERSFAAYRKRVRESHPEGEKLDRYFASGVKVEENEEGQKVLTHNQADASIYTRIFDSSNREWSKDGDDYNLYFLKVQENIFNDKLCSKGHLFLNEVLEALGFDHTPEGAITGWLYDGDGDGFVDFNLDRVRPDALNSDERNAYENGWGISIEFNVDGVIYDKI